MKQLLTATAALFGLLPGIAIIRSGLGVPPGRGRELLYGGVIEAIGIITLLVLKINSSAIKEFSRSVITMSTAVTAALALCALLLYTSLFGHCVVTQEPRGTVFFPLWTSGEIDEIVTRAGGRAAAIEAYGRYAIYDAVERSGDLPVIITDASLLTIYVALFTLLTLASGIPATYLTSDPAIQQRRRQKSAVMTPVQ
jgi:hypothetical protein